MFGHIVISRQRLEQWYRPLSAIGLGIFALSFFLAPDKIIQKEIFYKLVIAPLFLSFFFVNYKPYFKDPLMVLCAIALAYLALTILWSPDYSKDRLRESCRQALYIYLLFLSAMYVARFYHQQITRLLPVYLLVVSIAGIALALWFYGAQQWRMTLPLRPDWNFYNQLRLGNAYGVVAIVSLLLIVARLNRITTGIAVATFVVSTIVVLLTRAQGATYSVVLTLPALLLLNKRLLHFMTRYKWLILGAIAVLGICVYWLNIVQEFVRSGWSQRNFIWPVAIDEWLKNWAFGSGRLISPDIIGTNGRHYYHEHNIQLALLRQSGLLGFLLCSSVYLGLLLRCLFTDTRYHRACAVLLIYSFFSLLSGGKYPLGPPEDTWVWLWLPIALAFTADWVTQRRDENIPLDNKSRE